MDSEPQPPDAPVSAATMRCLNCRGVVPVDAPVCPLCGFPFTCDITPIDSPRLRLRSGAWRTILGLAAIFFLITSGLFSSTGYDTYQGYVLDVAARLSPETHSGIPVNGPSFFVDRTELALALLEQRAPDFYWRMQDSVKGIDYLAPNFMEGPAGKRISLVGIGAVSEPDTGKVQVLTVTAFPNGVDELWDRNVFSYAGVLVHELRHIELHATGQAPGGWQEEWMCERAAYAAEKQMQAPPGLLLQYEMYLADPQNRRYQRWYKWYEQWD
jgi:hypothetical protein